MLAAALATSPRPTHMHRWSRIAPHRTDCVDRGEPEQKPRATSVLQITCKWAAMLFPLQNNTNSRGGTETSTAEFKMTAQCRSIKKSVPPASKHAHARAHA